MTDGHARGRAAVRVFQSNTTINRVLSGFMLPGNDTAILVQQKGRARLVQVGTWTRKKAERYVDDMLRVSVAAPRVLYRGTGLPWLVNLHTGNRDVHGIGRSLAVEALTVPDILYMIRCGTPCKLTHPISCTTDVHVAEEFARRASSSDGGFVHVIEGCERAVDVNALLGSDSLASRESEFIVLPPRVVVSGEQTTSVSLFMHPTRVTGNRVWWRSEIVKVDVASTKMLTKC